jgi:hypothetical protein
MAIHCHIIFFKLWMNTGLGNFNKSIEFAEKGYAIDSTNYGILELFRRQLRMAWSI